MPERKPHPATVVLTVCLSLGAPQIAMRYIDLHPHPDHVDDTQPERHPNSREVRTLGIAASTTSSTTTSTTTTPNPMLGI